MLQSFFEDSKLLARGGRMRSHDGDCYSNAKKFGGKLNKLYGQKS